MFSQKRCFGLIAAMLMGLAGQAPAIAASVIVQYAFPLGSYLPTTTALNVTSAAVSETGSSADLAQGVALPNTVYLQQLILSTTAATAVSNNQYFQFTVGANAGYALNLSDLSFDAGRGGSSTPRGWVLRSSIDGFAANIATAAIPTVQPTMTPFSVALSASPYQGLLSPVTFRIYGYSPAAPGVGNYFDNLTLNGLAIQVQAVPIPGAMAMFLDCPGSFGGRLRRRTWR